MRFFGVSILLVSLALASAGCGFFDEKPDKTKNWSAQRLYDSAKAALNGGDYETAIDYFDKLISRFPFGLLAQQGSWKSPTLTTNLRSPPRLSRLPIDSFSCIRATLT